MTSMNRQNFERVSPEAVGIPSRSILELVEYMADPKHGDAHSVMVYRRGKICAEGWWAPYAPGKRHCTWSFTKTVVGMAVGIAYTQGLLDLDEPLCDILKEESPDSPSKRLKEMTIRRLLMMSSGMKDEKFGNDAHWISDFLHADFFYDPGNGFSYISNGTSALGVAVARRSGMPLQEFVRINIFDKVGVDASNVRWITLPDGSVLGAGGLLCTTEDMLRIMQLYLYKGCINGEQIIREDFVAEATTKQNENSFKVGPIPNGTNPVFNAGYGYQLWMMDYPSAYWAYGAQGQNIMVFPSRDLVVVTTQIINKAYERDYFEAVYRLADSCADGVLPEDAPAAELLKNRLRTLAVPAPRYAPVSPIIPQISGKRYRVQEGRFTFYPVFQLREHMGTDIEITAGVDSFALTFEDTCRAAIHFTEDGLERSLTIATDGAAVCNYLTNPYQVYSEIEINGYWENDDCFVMEERWTEGTVVKTVKFEFNQSGVAITGAQTLGAMGGYAGKAESAFAVPLP